MVMTSGELPDPVDCSKIKLLAFKSNMVSVSGPEGVRLGVGCKNVEVSVNNEPATVYVYVFPPYITSPAPLENVAFPEIVKSPEVETAAVPSWLNWK